MPAELGPRLMLTLLVAFIGIELPLLLVLLFRYMLHITDGPTSTASFIFIPPG